MTVAVVFAVAGVVALFLSIWGGGVKAKEVEIPSASLGARFIVGLIGLILIGASVWLSVPNAGNPQPIAPPNPISSTSIPVSQATIATTEIMAEGFYDDFNDLKFDGTINTEKWAKLFDNGCFGFQQNGSVFVTTNTKNNQNLLCRFLIRNPRWVQGSELKIFEAKIRISSDHNREYVAQVLEFVASDGWALSCGIEAGKEGPEVVLDVDEIVDRVHKSTPIQYDRWYKIRLEVDNATMTFACYIDDQFLASVESKIASDLKASSFERGLLGLRSANASATTSFDDVRISP